MIKRYARMHEWMNEWVSDWMNKCTVWECHWHDSRIQPTHLLALTLFQNNLLFTFVLFHTRIAFYISGLILLLFKILPIKIHTLLHAFELIVKALLLLWLRYLQNMHSAPINWFFWCRKTLTSHFIFFFFFDTTHTQLKLSSN